MRARGAHSARRGKVPRIERQQCRPQLERLEGRLLLTVASLDASPDAAPDISSLLTSCTGMDVVQTATASAPVTGDPAPGSPLASVPQLHSNASATAKLYLDFNGHYEATWGGWSNVNTPAFDQDGDTTSFSSGELASINEIWARVAEDYAPFNIDVTTVDPGNQNHGTVAVIAVGGNSYDWYGYGAGGVAYIGGFASSYAPNVGYVFPSNLGNSAKNIAEAAAHEAGHLFGLSHQSTWSGSTLTNEYNPGNGAWAPIMGVSYYATRSTWYNGTPDYSSTQSQDDMAIIAGAANGFGYRADDYGSTIATASALSVSGGTSVNFAGLIGQADDQDVWSFTTTGGAVTFQLTGTTYGSDLDGVLELWNSSGGVIATDNPSGSQNASLSVTLAAGTYYLVAHSAGDYGDCGQYTISGTLPSGTITAPEIDLTVGGVGVADGGTVNFGSTTQGTSVSKTITVTNLGTATLSLTSLNSGNMPSGFTLVSNVGSTSLAPGQSTTFTVQLDGTTTGPFSGTIQLFNNDSNENPYDLTLSGTVTTPPAPEIDLTIGGVSVADGGTVDFGSTTQGTSVSKTITVTNLGTATLSLTSLNSASMPSGFTLVSNVGSTSLAPGQSTSFTVQLNATSTGSFSGAIQLVNNDSNENPYDLTLSGTVTAPPTPEIDLTIGGVSVADGGTVDFGSTTQGTSVSKTITVTNLGTATLSLTSLNSASMPSGFTLVSNIGSTSLAPGQSTSFTVQLNATSTGSFSGAIQLVNNDSNENPYDLALTGTVAAPLSPEIDITIGGVSVADGGTVSFGSTTQGTAVSKSITVTNLGTATLSLTSLNSASMPSGFTLVSNVGSTSLAPGQSTSFTIQLNATNTGSFSGAIQLVNNDSNENPYDLTLTGAVTAPLVPEIDVIVGGVSVADGGTVNFGSTTQGTSVTKTITVTNLGTATLSLTSLNSATMPAGFTLMSNVGSTSLAPGQSTSFTVQLDASSTGSFSGAIQLLNNDSNENPYDLTLTGTVVAPLSPEIDITIGGVSVADGGTVSFGSTTQGTAVTKSITVTNLGTATLSLTSLNSASMPGGFTLVSNVGSTSLAPGQSTSFTVQLNATSTGSFSGAIQLLNNDSNENPYDLTLTGAVTAPLAPEIDVTVGGVSVADGGTVNFGSTTQGTSVSRTFAITNLGTGTLSLTSLNSASMPSGFTLVSNLGSTSLAPGQSTSFTVRLDAASTGSYSGTIQLVNNDSNENPYDLTLVGGVAAAANPQLTVLVAGQTLTAGGTVDFGSTIVGTTLERTITIRNDGNATLTLTPPASLPSGFTLLQNLGTTSLAPGATTSFVVRLTAQTAGTFSGQISVVSNDAAHSPFTFTVTGTVAAAVTPLTKVVDDGDAGNTLVGAWTRTANKGYGNDIHTAYKGLGYVYSTWSFGSLPQGQYRVYATWTVNSTNATNAPYSILDGTTLRSTVAVNQRLVANDLNADGGHWKLLGTVTANSGTLVVKLTNLANGYVVADAVRIERVTNVSAPQPEIDVLAGGISLTSGGSVAFGQQNLGSPRTIDFTITNSGTASLSLTPIDTTKLPAGFSLVSNVGTTLLTPGESTTFSLRLDAQAAGSFSGTISLANNDPNESTFTFQVSGSVVDPNAPVTKIIDAGKAGNQLVGTWSHNTARGYGGEMYTANKGTGSITSSWTFTALPPGTYQVQATWRISTLNATNAPFTIYNGSQAAFTTKVNQQLTPSGYWDGTTLWQSLGTVTLTGSTLVVKLTNAANGLVVADAIRIVRVAAGAPTVTTSTPPTTTTTNSALASLLSTSYIGAGQPSAPNNAPAVIAAQPIAPGMIANSAVPDALPSLLPELEDRILAETLDLLSQARAAASGQSNSAADAHSAALLALLISR